MILKENIKCPQCNKKIRIKIINDISNLKTEDIVSMDFLKVICPNCNQKVTLDYPFYYLSKKFLITYKMSKKESIKTRETDTLNDFKEKYLILSDDVDDILAELLKDYIKKQLEVEGEIRYEGLTETDLLFYVFSKKSDVKISKLFYDDLLKKSKFRNLEKSHKVNSDNYLNFIRLK